MSKQNKPEEHGSRLHRKAQGVSETGGELLKIFHRSSLRAKACKHGLQEKHSNIQTRPYHSVSAPFLGRHYPGLDALHTTHPNKSMRETRIALVLMHGKTPATRQSDSNLSIVHLSCNKAILM